jgi:hypothetical protein
MSPLPLSLTPNYFMCRPAKNVTGPFLIRAITIESAFCIAISFMGSLDEVAVSAGEQLKPAAPTKQASGWADLLGLNI